ncbi:hypothetical protein QVD17_35525 [Tagetes erecta]|uniref:Uncharacterized protein n=1 Tax=Tagetes erecta TaxID=13708 RepID=A0AAD8NF76_TARER|nr:hypothetical protein QVD17_35525 [Tagetes erecta]
MMLQSDVKISSFGASLQGFLATPPKLKKPQKAHVPRGVKCLAHGHFGYSWPYMCNYPSGVYDVAINLCNSGKDGECGLSLHDVRVTMVEGAEDHDNTRY